MTVLLALAAGAVTAIASWLILRIWTRLCAPIGARASSIVMGTRCRLKTSTNTTAPPGSAAITSSSPYRHRQLRTSTRHPNDVR